MQSWADFDRLENEHYSAMFAEYNRETEYEEETKTYSIWWQSDKEWTEDSYHIEAESAEDARAEFEWLLDTGRLKDIPEDAVITEVREVA